MNSVKHYLNTSLEVFVATLRKKGLLSSSGIPSASDLTTGTLNDALLSSNVAFKSFVNSVLSTKASKVNGKVPDSELPDAKYFDGFTGSGDTQQDPYKLDIDAVNESTNRKFVTPAMYNWILSQMNP